MDLGKLDLITASSEGVQMELYHPVEEVSFDPPVYITVVGMDSDTYQKASRDIQNKRLKRIQAKGRVRFQATAEELEQESVELLARCIVGWENIEWEGSPLTFNYENAKKLMGILWIREQVDTFIGDRANFLKT